ncbi:MAG: hypothetical protein IT440_00530 [Phycisphaeraceae bacterium]|nr:hypothetical protein [Phycisphaeraceae bacterium]
MAFHLSFDDQTLQPEMAAGPKGLIGVWPAYGAQAVSGKTPGEYGPGIVGQALRTESCAGVYAMQGNITIRSSGSLAFWVKPLDWKNVNDNDTVFFSCQPPAGCMGVERQSAKVDEAGKVLSNEAMLGWIRKDVNMLNATVALYPAMKNQTWHLIVFNWAWPTFSMSIDGSPFVTVSLAGVPNEILVALNSFAIGSRGGAPTLIDEVMIFRRPLEAAETRLLYDTVWTWFQVHSPQTDTQP